MSARTLILAIAGAAVVAGCSKNEPPPAPKKAAAPKATGATPAPGRPVEIDEGLKERLARQEAAARMFERSVLQPPPPKVPDPPPTVKAATAPQPATPARPPVAASRPPEPPEPAKAAARAEPATSAPVPPAPTSQAPASPPPAAPRSDVAAARPAPAPTPVPAALRLVTRVDPDFPREATQAGVDQGSVKARMTLDAGGNVTRVEIVEANPRRVFDRAVVRALSQWRYSDGAAGRTVDMEIAFRR
jgi:protein TonB